MDFFARPYLTRLTYTELSRGALLKSDLFLHLYRWAKAAVGFLGSIIGEGVAELSGNNFTLSAPIRGVFAREGMRAACYNGVASDKALEDDTRRGFFLALKIRATVIDGEVEGVFPFVQKAIQFYRIINLIMLKITVLT